MSSWEIRELPVLRATRDLLARGRAATAADIARATGLAPDEVNASLRVLAEAKGPYVTGHGLLASDGEATVTALTERAEGELERIRYAEAREHAERPDSVPPPDHPLPPGALPR